MKVCCVSDLHGHCPEVPDCDLLLIGGDIVPTSAHDPKLSSVWLRTFFRPWLEEKAARMKVAAVAGNHDFIFQDRTDLVPDLSWHFLRDSGVEFQGLKIWGSPWQPVFGGWAFNLEEHELAEKWKLIPDDTDILLLHGPPHGLGDRVVRDGSHAGSTSLRARIEAISPRLVVCGHIHEGFGEYTLGRTAVVNASFVDERYRPRNQLVIVDFP